MGKTVRKTGFSLLLAIGFTLPAIAAAGAPSQIDRDSVTVSFADLDIYSDAGAKVLYSRLKRASARACDMEPYWELGSLSRARIAKSCYDEALSTAVENIDSDALKNIHTG